MAVFWAARALASGEPTNQELFVDRAGSTGLDFVHFNGMTGEYYLVEVNGFGGALLDYDNDGDLDVFLLQGQLLGPGKTLAEAVFPPPGPPPLSDRLFRNDLEVQADGTILPSFTDVTEKSGIHAIGYGMGVATGDYDNNGWTDLYVTNFGSNQMLRNNGDGTFSDVTEETGTDDIRWSVPAAFFDFDSDGWLDLFVGNYVDFSFSRRQRCPSPSGAPDYCAPLSYQAVSDRLFRNRGDGGFEDVTRRSGIHGEYGNALGVVTADFNGDGRIDLYVANDMSLNQMWINLGDGTFRNDALIAGSAVNEEGRPEASMGVVAGDVDADGDEDLFMTHIDGETNTLYINDGTGLFRDVTDRWELGVASRTSTAFGTAWLDFDQDGWLDLIIANGAVSVLESQLRQGDPYPLKQINQLFHNLGNGRFEEVTDRAGAAFELAEVSRGLAMGDIDNDGDPDVVITNNSGPARLLINQWGAGGNWVGLRLVEPSGQGDVLGTRVAIHRHGQPTLWRRVQVDGSYASASDPRIVAGLGSSTSIDKIEVFWPGGQVDTWSGVPVGGYITLLRRHGKEQH